MGNKEENDMTDLKRETDINRVKTDMRKHLNQVTLDYNLTSEEIQDICESVFQIG